MKLLTKKKFYKYTHFVTPTVIDRKRLKIFILIYRLVAGHQMLMSVKRNLTPETLHEFVSAKDWQDRFSVTV